MRMRLEGMYGLAGVLLAAAALEILVRADVVPATSVPPPSAILQRTRTLLANPEVQAGLRIPRRPRRSPF